MGSPYRSGRWSAIAVAAAMAIAGCGDDDDDEPVTDETTTQAAQSGSEWSYSGDTGPEHWGSLSPEYAACSEGTEQSPIDLTGGSGDPPALAIDFGSSPLALENNGHSVEAKVQGDNTIALDGDAYALDQFHFHAPSEHTIDGEALPLELHFVNATADGKLAVLGVMVAEGDENPAWSAVTDALSKTVDEGDTAAVDSVDLKSLLPKNALGAQRWSYDGSLTTPPCSEGVAWTVFAEPIEMSAEQIAAFTAAYDANARPVQPLGDRVLAFGS